MSQWQRQRSTTVYENAWIRVREDEVTRPDGTPGIYGVVALQHPTVFVVPLTDDDEVVLVEVDRYAIGRMSLEVPAGGSDGEDPLHAARRELREETGLVADEWRPLAVNYSFNGVCDAPGHVFLACGLRPAGVGADRVGDVGGAADAAGAGPVDVAAEQAVEGIVGVRRVPWREALDLVRDGGITDAETVAALLHTAVALGRVR
jgi:8-oxo-dGTP pyrophosphatase MutT (NUDIX family)